MNQFRGYSPAYLCFGLCLMWKAYALPFSSTLPEFNLLTVAVPLAVLVCVAFSRGLAARTPSWVLWAAGALGCAATALVGLAALPDPSLGLVVPEPLAQAAAGTLLAVYVLFFILWAEMYAGLDLLVASVSIGGSYLLAGAGYFLFGMLDPSVCLGFSIALPLMSAWALLGCRNRTSARDGRETDGIQSLGDLVTSELFPWRTVVAIAAVSLAAGLSRVNTTASEDLRAVGLAGLAFLAVVLVGNQVARTRSAYQTHEAAFLVMAACLVVGVLLARGQLAHLCIGVGQTLSSIVLVLLICDSSHRFGLPAVPVLAIARAVTSAAFIVGGALGASMPVAGNTPLASASMVYLAMTAVVVVAACAYWMHRPGVSQTQPEKPLEVGAVQGADGDTSDNRALLVALEEQIRSRSKTLAAECCLSRREAEVLELLAWGKSARRIEEILTLSPNTVKTHVRHVYTKLGIHSRAELDALLFNATRDETTDLMR